MKIASKTALCMFVALAPSLALADAPATTPTYSEQDQFQLIFHLFAPWHQGSQKPLAELRRNVQARVMNGEVYNAAFNDEVRKFLHCQIKDALLVISKLQGHAFSDEEAGALTEQMIIEKLEKPFAAAHNCALFEQDPTTLPAHIFTYFTTPYYVETYKTHALPEINRFDPTAVMFYLHSIRIGLNKAGQVLTYAQYGVSYGQKILDDFGVPKE